MRAILACGGTGGHIFPALALAHELLEKGWTLLFATDQRGAAFVAGNHGMEIEVIPAAAFFGRSLVKKIGAGFEYLRGRGKAAEIIKRFGPDAVVGVGGYTSFPLIRAAASRRIPYFLLEQNSVPGRVTRLAARGAKEVFSGIPLTESLKGKISFTGNPLRKSVIVDGNSKGDAILILGGSQGAKSLNNLGYHLASVMTGEKFVIVTGRRDYQEMASMTPLPNLELVEFTDHPEDLYRIAKVAISRSGAMVLSELLANGIPTIFVPFPYAVDDHQKHNALWASSNGAALTIEEKDIDGIEPALRTLLGDQSRLEKMSEASRLLVPREAASVIAERIERCLAA